MPHRGTDPAPTTDLVTRSPARLVVIALRIGVPAVGSRRLASARIRAWIPAPPGGPVAIMSW